MQTGRHAGFDWLGGQDIAHRGLFNRRKGREENALSAILSAAEKGYAVELDVCLTKDNRAIVFHDTTLDRLTDGKGRVDDHTLSELEHYPLKLAGEPIPRLKTALDGVNGRVPVYIEIKSARDYDPIRLCERVTAILKTYDGPACVMSFDPRVCHWFSLNAPHIARGIVLDKLLLGSIRGRLTLRYAITRSKPDFLSVDIRQLPHPYCTRWRNKGGKLITWTVRTKDNVTVGREHTDALTFEKPAVPYL